ncbi:phage tail assembly chaperone [Pseudomonas sp. MM213]|uniref:phage tail assembly chaperone n=1 Tax=Pseudomonas sp. MM213 TaxID=2866807 RepID=UPI001CF3B91B|nr:phage tail assembly chaperone [Pseudomonas sp. MM213]
MSVRSFARIEGGRVAERFDAEELPPFHPSLIWIECAPGVCVGWLEVDGALVPLPAPVASPEELAASSRTWRDGVIEDTKWLRERHRDEIDLEVGTTLTADQFRELLVYLQTLRDWPQSPDFPDILHRPVAPDWIAEQAP